MQLANTARTTLVNSALATATSVTLSDASRFPTVTSTLLTGTVTSDSNPYIMVGTGTLFTSQLVVGDSIVWTGLEHRRVLKIIDDTHLIIDRPASVAAVALTKCDGYYATFVVGGGLAREYVFVTATSGAVFTVVRAQDGSTALALPAGTGVEYRVTAGVLQQVIEQAVLSAVLALEELKGADLVGVSATNYVSATVRQALEEVMSALLAHINSTMAHTGTHITFTEAGWSASNVELAILESVTKSLAALAGHVAATPAHAASAISFAPYGGISATDVQNAIQQAWDAFSVTTNSGAKVADVITSSGTSVNPLDAYQLSRAVSTYSAGADYWQCAGSGTAFTLSTPAQFPGIPGAPAFTGTGNGTMTGVAGTTQSVAETFTVTCITPGTHAIFSVVGTVSGALSNATADSAYTATPIGFTIHTGTTPFASGDKFVVAMAAAYGLRKPLAYYEGMRVRFIANAANFANATVDVGGLGAKSITVPPFADQLPTNAWIAGSPVELVYTGSGFVMVKQPRHVKQQEVFTTGTGATWNIPPGVCAFTVTAIASGGGSGGAPTDSTVTYNGSTITAHPGSFAEVYDNGTSSGSPRNLVLAGGGASGGDMNIPGTPAFGGGGSAVAGHAAYPNSVPGAYPLNGLTTVAPSGYGSGCVTFTSDTRSAGSGGGTSIKRFTRVAGVSTATYTVGTTATGAGTGVVIFEYIPWTDA